MTSMSPKQRPFLLPYPSQLPQVLFILIDTSYPILVGTAYSTLHYECSYSTDCSDHLSGLKFSCLYTISA